MRHWWIVLAVALPSSRSLALDVLGPMPGIRGGSLEIGYEYMALSIDSVSFGAYVPSSDSPDVGRSVPKIPAGLLGSRLALQGLHVGFYGTGTLIRMGTSFTWYPQTGASGTYALSDGSQLTLKGVGGWQWSLLEAGVYFRYRQLLIHAMGDIGFRWTMYSGTWVSASGQQRGSVSVRPYGDSVTFDTGARLGAKLIMLPHAAVPPIFGIEGRIGYSGGPEYQFIATIGIGDAP